MGDEEYVNSRGIRYVIDVERCKGCGLCVENCRRNVIEMTDIPNTNENGYVHINVKNIEGCTGCGFCTLFCGDGAIREISLTGEWEG